MNPVICFYQDDQLIYSEDYLLIQCDYHADPTAFLSTIQVEYPTQMKVIQVNFDDLQKQKAQPIIKSDFAVAVFILNHFKLIAQKDLVTKKEKLDLNFTSHLTKNEFLEKVRSIRTDIQNGRYYQVNLTSCLSSPVDLNSDPFEIFKYYLQKFKSQYTAFLPRLDSEILCYSPELFLEKKGKSIITRPIKGTTSQNEPFEDLLKNEKENAELSMIVDLLRNDLQAVCFEKVTVSEHRKELNLNYLIHTYSEISGKTNLFLPEILEHMLPAGSISGCPKKESLKAINELETNHRHFYTGCIGWWQNEDFKLNLAIRSFMLAQNTLTYFSGCGIVYDSDPDKEWKEFLRKAKHLELSHEF